MLIVDRPKEHVAEPEDTEAEDMPQSVWAFRGLSFPRWFASSAALLSVAALCLVGYLVTSYIASNRLAAEEDLTIRRMTSANMDLQVALDRLRDGTERTLQRLAAENDLLRTRVSELEQYQSQPQSANPYTRMRNNRAGSTTAPTRTFGAAPAPASSEAAPAVQVPAATPAFLEGSINFSAPSWVPDYFSNETPSLTGSGRQKRGGAQAGMP